MFEDYLRKIALYRWNKAEIRRMREELFEVKQTWQIRSISASIGTHMVFGPRKPKRPLSRYLYRKLRSIFSYLRK